MILLNNLSNDFLEQFDAFDGSPYLKGKKLELNSFKNFLHNWIENEYNNVETKDPEDFLNLFNDIVHSITHNSGWEHFYDKNILISFEKDGNEYSYGMETPFNALSQFFGDYLEKKETLDKEQIKSLNIDDKLEKKLNKILFELKDYKLLKLNNTIFGLIEELRELFEYRGIGSFSGNYVCYAYEIVNYNNKRIIDHKIYGFDEATKLDGTFLNYKDLKRELEKIFILGSDWDKDIFYQHY